MSEAAYENLKSSLGKDYLDTSITLDKPFTEEEKRAVLEQANHGINEPVKLRQFATAEEFDAAGPSNFYTHFMPEDPDVLIGNIKRTRRAFQRFEILYPEMAQRMIGKYDGSEMTHTQKQELFNAYEIMSGLVDAKDATVVDEDGKVNAIYLMA